MDRKAEGFAWKGAVAVVAVLVSLLLEALSGSLDVHFSELLKNVSIGSGGVAGAFGVAAAVKFVSGVLAELVGASRSKRDETRRRQGSQNRDGT
jgi:hypothetical protein